MVTCMITFQWECEEITNQKLRFLIINTKILQMKKERDILDISSLFLRRNFMKEIFYRIAGR